MAKIVLRDRVKIFLGNINPIEGGLMRNICESHELLRDQREELRNCLKISLFHIRALNNKETPAQDPLDLQKQIEVVLDSDRILDDKQIW